MGRSSPQCIPPKRHWSQESAWKCRQFYFMGINNSLCKKTGLWKKVNYFDHFHLAFENLLLESKARTWHTSESPVPTTAFGGSIIRVIKDGGDENVIFKMMVIAMAIVREIMSFGGKLLFQVSMWLGTERRPPLTEAQASTSDLKYSQICKTIDPDSRT